jgi:hypothetical protein
MRKADNMRKQWMAWLGSVRRNEAEVSAVQEPRLSAHIVISYHHEGAILLDQQRGVLFKVNRIGSEIVKALAGCMQPREVAGLLSASYGILPARALKDVEVFLLQLHKAGFLTASAEAVR